MKNHLASCALRVYYSVIVLRLLPWVIAEGLQCPPCDKIHCSPKKASGLNCKGGVTTGVCNCCPSCAKVERERCGGEYSYLGKCDRGLYCDSKKTSQSNFVYPSRKEPVGMCTKLPSHQADEGFTVYCRPKCSPTFCRRNPRAICSASQTAEEKQECQGHCQHTSCSACRFQREPVCVKCPKDDFRCLKRFGKCIKRTTCSRKKFPCKWRRLKEEEKGKFICQVPGCLELP